MHETKGQSPQTESKCTKKNMKIKNEGLPMFKALGMTIEEMGVIVER